MEDLSNRFDLQRQRAFHLPLLLPFELVEEGHNLPGSRAAEWMSQSNGTTIGVHFPHGNAQFLYAVNSLWLKKKTRFKQF